MSLHPRGSLAGFRERLRTLLLARPAHRIAPPRLRGKLRRAAGLRKPGDA